MTGELLSKLTLRLDQAANRLAEIERDLADPAAATDGQRLKTLSIQRAAIVGMVGQYRSWQKLRKQIAENQQIIDQKLDPDLTELAEAELPTLQAQADSLMQAIADDLVTAEDRSVGGVILELRGGTGGDEAALWTGDLLQMYQKLALIRHWDFSPMELTHGDVGGVRSAVIQVTGDGVWQTLGYEGGVHCVKRVPATETQGRIHTSTATVAVLPEPEKLQIDIPESDVKMDITTAQGPGGQNVNKVATAVKMVHIPTGIEVRMQESKSQQQNRAKAWALLRARVYDFYQRQKQDQRQQQRSAMIGSGERSERIRTYRYKESIVVDHRLEQMNFPLAKILAGELAELTDALIACDRQQRLASL